METCLPHDNSQTDKESDLSSFTEACQPRDHETIRVTDARLPPPKWAALAFMPLASNAHGNGRSTWSDCSRKNAEGVRELARSVERPSEPQANGLTDLLGRICTFTTTRHFLEIEIEISHAHVALRKHQFELFRGWGILQRFVRKA